MLIVWLETRERCNTEGLVVPHMGRTATRGKQQVGEVGKHKVAWGLPTNSKYQRTKPTYIHSTFLHSTYLVRSTEYLHTSGTPYGPYLPRLLQALASRNFEGCSPCTFVPATAKRSISPSSQPQFEAPTFLEARHSRVIGRQFGHSSFMTSSVIPLGVFRTSLYPALCPLLTAS
jgi:hypothetical protein